MLTAATGADALFITPIDHLDSMFFEKVSSSVKVIATHSVGFEHIDLEAAGKRKIAIAYTPGISSDATADIAMLRLLGAEGQELVRTRAWRPLSPNMLLGWQAGGKVLGIVAMGRVGQAMAQRARGFGMKIHYCVEAAAELRRRRHIPRGSVRLASRESVSEFACSGNSRDASLFECRVDQLTSARRYRCEHGSRESGRR
jgi:lactate dehydrogenase-like 2-hydroxyacid dehydrogenase